MAEAEAGVPLDGRQQHQQGVLEDPEAEDAIIRDLSRSRKRAFIADLMRPAPLLAPRRPTGSTLLADR